MYHTLLLVGVGKCQLESGTSNDPLPPLQDKVNFLTAPLREEEQTEVCID